jgi:simple sugar transport system substrate-binding protein
MRSRVALTVALSLLATACRKSDRADHHVVGFAQIGAESDWRTAETNSIQSEAKRRGIELKFADAQGKQENQIRALKGFVAQKVDAIVLAPVIETGWNSVLRDVKAAGIPVVLVDRGVAVDDDSLYATLIASDFVEEGRMAARWLVDATHGKCNVVELQGTVGSAPALDRQKGFAEIVATQPGIVLLATQSGEFTRAKGKEVMEAFLKTHGKAINAVYAHNDDMALGAIQAIEAYGSKPGIDVLVVSIDGVKAAFEAIIAGKANATIECNPILGPMAFDAVERILRGEHVEKRFVVKDRAFDRDAARAELAKREY